MQALEPMQLFGLIAVVAAIVFACRAVERGVAQRRRRARRTFTAGFICGLTAGVVIRNRHRGLRAFRLVARPPRLAVSDSANYLAHRLLDVVSSNRQSGWERLSLGRGR